MVLDRDFVGWSLVERWEMFGREGCIIVDDVYDSGCD